jgi:large subunit ribosomal protein L17
MRGIFLSPDLRIVTTVPKAKEVRPYVEKMITLARNKTLYTYRRALQLLPDEDAVARLFKEIGPSFEKSGRPGGYTRLIKRAKRRLGDGGYTAFLQIIREEKPSEEKKTKRAAKKAKGAKKAAGRKAAEEAVEKKAAAGAE